MSAVMRQARWATIIILVLLGIGFIGVNFVRRERQLTRNAQCRGRLGQLAFVLQQYVDKSGTFPPLVVRDDRGKPLFSWRVLLLPYFDENDAYAELDLSEPWDSPKNVAVAKRVSSSFVSRLRSPNDFGPDSNDTSFVAINFPVNRKGGRRIMVVELHNTGIHWMEPRDLTLGEIRSRVVEMVGRGEAVHVLTSDGQVGTITESSLSFYGSVNELFNRWSMHD